MCLPASVPLLQRLWMLRGTVHSNKQLHVNVSNKRLEGMVSPTEGCHITESQ